MSRIHAGCACAAAIAVAIAVLGTDAEARITRIVVDRTEALTDGSGYERLHGRAFGEVDPDGPDGATITDLRGAPRNARGQVEYVTTFGLLKPVDMARASGVLWYELVNRGNALRTFDPLTGDGHVTLVSGWQGDLAQTGNNFAVKVPLARQADGSPITGAVMARLADAKAGTASRPLAMLANAIPYDAATLDTREARLVTKQGEQRSGVAQGVTEVPATDTKARRRLDHIEVNGRHSEPRCFTMTTADGASSVLLLGASSADPVAADVTLVALQRRCGAGLGS